MNLKEIIEDIDKSIMTNQSILDKLKDKEDSFAKECMRQTNQLAVSRHITNLQKIHHNLCLLYKSITGNPYYKD